MNDRILITGGSGFIGTNLVQHYLDADRQVLNLDHAAPRNLAHAPYWRNVDLLDHESVQGIFEDFRPTHVLHMAARTDLHGTVLDDYTANTDGLNAVLRALISVDSVERVIFASSRMVCQIAHRPTSDREYSPPNAYGISKVEGERLVRSAQLPCNWVIVRPTSIWGPWFGVPYKDFFLSIARGVYVHPRGRRIAKSFGFVGNTVHQLEALLSGGHQGVHGRTFYLGDYPPIEVYDMAVRIQRRMGARPIPTVPMPVLGSAARAGDIARRMGWREPPITSFRLSNLVAEMVYDLSQLEGLVGPLPYSLDQGIAETVDWMRRHREIHTGARNGS